MGRLVDTDDLEKGLAALMQRNGIKSWLSTAFDACDFESIIDDAPTVEAEPARHGQWEDDPYIWKCNVCKTWLMLEQGDADMNYCPNRGANMQEEEISE